MTDQILKKQNRASFAKAIKGVLIKATSCLVVMGFAVSASAGNEGAQALPKPLFIPIASVEFHSGLGPNGPMSIVVQISDQGEILAKTIRPGAPTLETKVANLTEKLSEVLNRAAMNSKDGELVDPNPDLPGCYDAPSVFYFAYNNGERVDLEKKVSCKTYYRSLSEDERKLLEALRAAKGLAFVALPPF